MEKFFIVLSVVTACCQSPDNQSYPVRICFYQSVKLDGSHPIKYFAGFG